MKKVIRNKAGFALVTIMGIMAVLGIMFTMLNKVGKQSVHTVKKLKNNIKAEAYAEAGIEYAYAVLVPNFSNRFNISNFKLDPNTSSIEADSAINPYKDGQFVLSITNDLKGQFSWIRSVGTCGDSNVEVMVLIEDANFQEESESYIPPDYNGWDIFNKAIATGGSAAFGGGGQVIGDSTLTIHSNGPLDIHGSIDIDCSISSSEEIILRNGITINGTATAPSVDIGNGNNKAEIVHGTTETSVTEVVIPPIDLEPYRLHAIANGALLTGDQNLTTNPPGGIWYVIGNAKIKNSITATIIATGNIEVQEDVVETHGIAVATLNGDIKYTSQAQSEGLIYTQTGEFSQQGGGSITGQIIAGGGAKKTGGGDLIFDKYLPQTPEDGTTVPIYNDTDPQIAAWQK